MFQLPPDDRLEDHRGDIFQSLRLSLLSVLAIEITFFAVCPFFKKGDVNYNFSEI